MRALVYAGAGDAGVIQLREVPTPVPGEGQLLVRVHAAGLNRADILQRKGRYPAPPGWPADIPGLELAGEVVEAGPGVTRWRAGDRVMGLVGGGAQALQYAESRNYTEPLFVFVVMVIAASRPVLRTVVALVDTAARWLPLPTPMANAWLGLAAVPLLGSLITEPAAMTIAALMLAPQIFRTGVPERLKYLALGVLFVNVSIGGTLTSYAAPPVLMVARPWGWDTLYMLQHFGWRAVAAILISTVVTYVRFRRELVELGRRRSPVDLEQPDEDVASGEPALLPLPAWLIAVHVFFVVWTVVNAHYPALFLGGFLFFLGFMRATTAYQSRLSLRAPLLVGFFLGGLVIHGGLQGWWIAPTLASLSETPLFFGATLLTAVNDNALITYLATLVPNFSEPLRMAVVEGAVTGGGLTVIANAPNPAGQALLARFFGGAVSPVQLLAGALVPTIVAAIAFRLF